MNKKRIRVCLLTDSLAMPRLPEYGDIEYEQTYPYKLKEKILEYSADGHIQIIPLLARSRTIVRAYQSLRPELFPYRPDIVVLHVGIVDCAPRVFTRRERALVSRLGPLKEPVIKFVHAHRRRIILTMPPKVYVKLKNFRSTAEKLRDVILANEDRRLLVVNIAPAPSEHAYRSPGLEENIRKYNEVLASICDSQRARLVDLLSEIQQRSIEKMILEDGHHLTASGNALLADMLYEEIVSVDLLKEKDK